MVGPPISAAPCTFAWTMEDTRPIAIGLAVTLTRPVGTVHPRRGPTEPVGIVRTNDGVNGRTGSAGEVSLTFANINALNRARRKALRGTPAQVGGRKHWQLTLVPLRFAKRRITGRARRHRPARRRVQASDDRSNATAGTGQHRSECATKCDR